MLFSVIIPVFNRPDELGELLESIALQQYNNCEVIVVEDGSTKSSRSLCNKYSLHYLYKENGGPVLARNFGARHAEGEYLLFLDSDTILPEGYFRKLESFIITHPDISLLGGPDRAAENFSPLQKAISYSMTSFFTTGGIRGGKHKISRFIPRSFNMAVKRSVFEACSGFAPLRFGEDMDLSMRILESGEESSLVEEAWLYHKRRTSLRQFYRQVCNSGRARIELSLRHRHSLKLVHLLPLLFTLACGALVLSCALLAGRMGWSSLFFLCPILLYALLLFLHSSIKEKSPKIGLLSVCAAFVQLWGYGLGFIDNFFKRCIFKRQAVSNIDNEGFYR